MSNFNLSHDEYKYLQKTIFGVDLDAKGSRGRRQSQMEDESPSSAELIVNQYKQPEEQGFWNDFADSVQMGAWQGVSDLARGMGALFNSDWLNQAADVAAKYAEENKETMSTKMREALEQNAFDDWDVENGKGRGIANIYWWAGNLGALIGQNLDIVVPTKIATSGLKFGGKLAGKYFSKEVADQVGKAAVKQASRFGIPAKYHKTIGYTAVMSAMSAGGRANKVREELSKFSNEELAQQHGFQTAYWDLKDSEEGQSLSDNEIFERARQQYYNEVGRDVMLDPAAIAADVTANAIGGLGGGIWGMPNVNKLLGKPAKSITGGLFKGALVEAGTEGIQGAAEQYAINDTAKEYYDPDRELSKDVSENVINSMALGAGFGGIMGGYEAGSHNRAMNRQKKRLLEAVSTGDERVDAQIRAQVEAYNRMANELDELVSPERLRALNQAGRYEVAKAKAKTEIPHHQRNLAELQEEFIQNGFDENDFNDFIEANLQQATADLQNLQTNPFKMGADFQKGLAEKQAYNAKLADAQARVNFFTQAKNAPKSGTEPSQVEGQSELQINPDDIKLSRSAMKSVEANIARGREAMTKAILDKSSVHRAMYNHELGGWVDFEWGDDGLTKPFNKKGEPIGKGIAHIIEARMRKDGMSYENVTKMLTQDIVNVIAQGQIAGHWVRNDGKSESVQIDYNGYRAGLIRNKGSNTWLLTAFELYPTDVNSAGSVDTEKTTHIKPTLTRPNMGAVGTENLPSFANDVKFSRSAPQETQSFYETEQRLGGKEAYEQAVKEGKTELDYRQWVQVRTPEFKAWFGDWENDPQNASKVINERTGEPLAVYHTSNWNPLNEENGSAIFRKGNHGGLSGNGIYFSEYPLRQFGSEISNVFLNVKKPITRNSVADDHYDGLFENLNEGTAVNFYRRGKLKQNWSDLSSEFDGVMNRNEIVAVNSNQIKSATDNTGEFDVNNDDIRFSFAGMNAQNADNAALVKAMDMVENGVNPEEIRKQTGWFQGADGKWRFEVMEDPKLITPHQAYEDFQWQTEYNQNELKTRLGEVWKDKRLFEAYPHLANLNVTIKPLSGNADGYFDPTTREIVLSSHLGESAMRSALVHEVQHVIQARERFLNGSGLDIEKARLKGNQTGNTSVDKEIAKLEQALSQTQDPNQIAEIQASIESYKELVAENNYQRIAGEVEARNAQTRLNMTEEERQARSPESTEDIPRYNQILRDYQGERAFSLNENADSDFAKAVDAVVAGKVPAGYINMGTTPDVLKMLGVGEGEVRISGGTIEKAMLNHLERHNNYDNNRHSMSPNALKRLPQQLNNPIAVFNSSTRENSFVVLTELTEFENGRNKPVIAALHFSKTKRGADLIDIASVYGRSDGQLANAFNKDLLYFNKAKGQQFLKTHPLQLHWDLTSDANLSALDIKTETDLSQYQGKQKTQTFDFTHEKSQIATAVGKGLSRHFEVTHSSELGIDDPTIEAAYNTKTGKIVIIADNIRANSVLSREERLKWVAWHELAHRGLQVRYGKDFQALMEKVDQNTTIRDLATALQKDRAELKDNRILAIEEAIAELHAAYTTGKMEELKSRYGLVVPRGREISLKSWFRIIAERIREFMAKIFGVETANRFSHDDLLNLLKDIQQSAGGDVNGVESDVRHSLNEDPNSSFAKAVDRIENAGLSNPKRYINMGTTPPVLQMLGLDEVKIAMRESVINKALFEHSVTAEDLKRLPEQINNPVAIMRSNPSSMNPNGLVVLTELSEVVNGKDKPLIAALQLKHNGDTLEVINISSVYGRDWNTQIGNDLSRTIYWNKTKGYQFARSGGLQLPNMLTSVDNLSAFNIKTETDLSQYQNSDLRFSRSSSYQSGDNTSVLNLARGGNIKAKKWTDNFSTIQALKETFKQSTAKMDEWFADSLRPVNDWIDQMQFSDHTSNVSGRDHEKRRLKDAMYTAKGKRDALNSELEVNFLKPILSKVAQIAKQSKGKINEETAKAKAGFWVSARYSIEKNMELLNIDEKAMKDAQTALNDAQINGSAQDIRKATEELARAEKQYQERKAAVWNKDFNNKDFKVGVAGGWSIPEAQEIMRNIERDIALKDLKEIGELIADLNQERLRIDKESGRYTEAEYAQFKDNRNYVPLTGDPNAQLDDMDFIAGAGANSLNIAKDRTLKGRTNSEAEDAIDAVWKAVGKSTTYSGWSEFKGKLDDLFETEVSLLEQQGLSHADALQMASKNLGIGKQKMQGLTRSSDNVLIAKRGGVYYEYSLPDKVISALKNDNVEQANDFLKVLSKPTSWYARGVTQWTLTFAPINMMRDTWEKSEFIRVQKVYDQNGKLLDSSKMDRIGRATALSAFTNRNIWTATKRLAFGQELRDSIPEEKLLKQLLKEGGVSNYGTYLERTEADLLKRIKRENSSLGSKLDKAVGVLESYNKTFDMVSALSAYKALVDNGVDSKQAAATTLELTNFRKTGSKMRGIKALYMFSQPTVMGASNLLKYLSTRKGQIRFLAYTSAMVALYAVLRSMDEEDETGNKMDQLGDITRFIPIPVGNGDYIKIPVGFGMPQMAWNFATNIVKGSVSDISFMEAGVNMVTHATKTFAPVSPSEISAAKYPLEKLALTFTPSILQPLMQNALNRSAFGGKITTNFVLQDRLKAEQSKSTTAQFWKDLAIDIQQTLGFDMHPEQIKNLYDGYSGMLGSLRELNTIFVDNPNREQLGRKTKTWFINQLYGAGNEFAVQSRYYEASEEAQQLANEYNYRKANKSLDQEWLTPERQNLIKWHEYNKRTIGKLRSEKAQLTKLLRAGKISAHAYEQRLKRYNEAVHLVQKKLLSGYRQMEGLSSY